jgi:uncharacterized membrane protein affecting hemolysin expression
MDNQFGMMELVFTMFIGLFAGIVLASVATAVWRYIEYRRARKNQMVPLLGVVLPREDKDNV